MVKFLALDANGLNALFSGSEISFANPYCKKKNSAKQSNKTADFSEAGLTASQVIALSGFCTSQFQFELYSWETNFSETIAIINEHFSSNLSYRYLDNASPPPRLA
tara:strand:+ start:198 stop:515 length:318 start_codon:yes stop_codon:yes gene_type:complete